MTESEPMPKRARLHGVRTAAPCDRAPPKRVTPDAGFAVAKAGAVLVGAEGFEPPTSTV